MRITLKKKIAKYRVFLVFLILNILFYGGYVIHHYAPDTYFTEALEWNSTIIQHIKNARWLMSGFAYLCKIFSIGHVFQQFVSWSTAIVSISAASTIVYFLLLEKYSDKNNKIKNILGFFAAFMLISNVFMVEYFIFAEYTGMICLGILFNVIGARFILEFLEKEKVRYFFGGVGFALLGINGHQGSFALFLCICTIFACDMFVNFKTFIKNNIIIGSAYLIPCLINTFQVKLGGATRAAHTIDIFASFQKATYGLINLFKTTANFMEYGIYALLLFIFGVYFLIKLIQNKSVKVLGFSIYCCLIATLGIYAPLLATDYNFIDVVPRTVYIMGGAFPIILLLILLHLNITWNKSILLPIMIFAFLIIQYHGISKIMASTYQANAVDRYEAQYIADYLRKYEEDTGIYVSKLAIYWDKNVCGYAPGVIGYGAVNERAMSNQWAAPLAIQCLDGYKMTAAESSEAVYKEHFQDKDWRQISNEQFVIIGDTLHLCAY